MDVAVKIMLKDPTTTTNNRLLAEITMLSKIEYHPNIAKFIGQIINSAPMMIVMEFCSSGNLRDYVRKVR